ncbi:MAG: tetratricopeptide repeat protein [Verrucomicrobiota bacterium JB022]|nr:tetratricopeptide repeat protein [Verrucomicrobiota bacterium JB022]
MRRLFCWWACLAAVVLQGQPAPQPVEEATIPMASEAPLAVPGQVWQRQAADSALRDGYPQIAATQYQELAAQAEEVDPGLLLNWSTALLAMGRLEQAREKLAQLPDPALPPARLRRALLAVLDGNWTQASSELEGLGVSTLPVADRSWYYLARAWLADHEDEDDDAREAFQAAQEAARSPGLVAQFELMQRTFELRHGTANEGELEQLRRTQRELAGARAAFEAGRLRAITLARLERRDEAVAVVEELLRTPGVDDFQLRPQFLLLLGLVAGEESGRSRVALRELVSLTQAPRELQQVALQILAANAFQSSDAAEFRESLNRWIEQAPPHPLTDRLLLLRAQLGARRGDLDVAERDAKAVVERFPGSRLVDPAYELLAQVNWRRDPPRYRTAADFLQRLRQRLQAGPERARLSVLIGDSYFLNEDYASAAEAYGNALRETGLADAGQVLYQQVLSEIRGGRLDAATEHLNTQGIVPLANEARWRAEWNLIDARRRAGQSEAARERITRLLSPELIEGFSLPLRLRLRWLQLRLALDAGDAAEVPARVDAVLQRVASADNATLAAAERERLTSYFRLIQGEAYFQLGQSEQGSAVFEELRRTAPGSGPAILSYLVAAREGAVQNRLVQAQQNLIELADLYPNSEYAPLALWEAALYAERRGLDSTYQEAINILERLAKAYPEHPLLFYVRLKQADISRKLNDFGTALLLYERVRNQFPQHPERFRAEMSRADVLMAAGSAQQPERLASAVLEYERLADLPSAPLDLRIEASYKWGKALTLSNDRDRAQGVYWGTLERFWPEAEAGKLGTQGRYWLSRTILELAGYLEQGSRSQQALDLYRRLEASGLPGASLARQRISRLVPAAE